MKGSSSESFDCNVVKEKIEKENKCKQCGKEFQRASGLKRHMKTQSGEKPFKCNLCDYVSAWAGDLRKHIKTHSGEKNL